MLNHIIHAKCLKHVFNKIPLKVIPLKKKDNKDIVTAAPVCFTLSISFIAHIQGQLKTGYREFVSFNSIPLVMGEPHPYTVTILEKCRRSASALFPVLYSFCIEELALYYYTLQLLEEC